MRRTTVPAGWVARVPEGVNDTLILETLLLCHHGSDRQLASACDVSHPTIASARRRLIAQGRITQRRWDDCYSAAKDNVQDDGATLPSLVPPVALEGQEF